MQRNKYRITDSSKVFLYSIFAIIFLQILFYSLLEQNNYFSSLLGTFLPQLAFFLTFALYNYQNKIKFKEASKLNFKISFVQILIVIAIGLIAVFSFSPFVSWFSQMLENWGYYISPNTLYLNNFWQLIVAELFIAVLPAICEELLFRGVVLNGLKTKGFWFAIFLSGLMFALMHMSLEQFIYQFFIGIVLGAIVLITNSIIPTILLHFFNNFIVILSYYIFGAGGGAVDYSTVWSNIEPFVYMILGIGLIVGLLFLLNKVSKKKNVQNKTNNNNTADISIPKEESNALVNFDKQLLIKEDKLWLGISLGITAAIWIASVVLSFTV